MFQVTIVQKIKTYILNSVPFSENHAVYEVMLKNMLGQTGHRWPYSTVHAFCMLDN